MNIKELCFIKACANLALSGNTNDVGVGGSNGVKAEGTMRVGDELGKR